MFHVKRYFADIGKMVDILSRCRAALQLVKGKPSARTALGGDFADGEILPPLTIADETHKKSDSEGKAHKGALPS